MCSSVHALNGWAPFNMAKLNDRNDAKGILGASTNPLRTLPDSAPSAGQWKNMLQVNLLLIAIAGCSSVPLTRTGRHRSRRRSAIKDHQTQ